eukprot:1188566-Prorocentrum_minimum.AAC.1
MIDSSIGEENRLRAPTARQSSFDFAACALSERPLLTRTTPPTLYLVILTLVAQDMVLRHFDYQWARGRFLDDDDVLDWLSPATRLKLRMYLCRDAINSAPVLQTAPPALIQQLVVVLRPRFCQEAELVCRQVGVGGVCVDVRGVAPARRRSSCAD